MLLRVQEQRGRERECATRGTNLRAPACAAHRSKGECCGTLIQCAGGSSKLAPRRCCHLCSSDRSAADCAMVAAQPAGCRLPQLMRMNRWLRNDRPVGTRDEHTGPRHAAIPSMGGGPPGGRGPVQCVWRPRWTAPPVYYDGHIIGRYLVPPRSADPMRHGTSQTQHNMAAARQPLRQLGRHPSWCTVWRQVCNGGATCCVRRRCLIERNAALHCC